MPWISIKATSSGSDEKVTAVNTALITNVSAGPGGKAKTSITFEKAHTINCIEDYNLVMGLIGATLNVAPKS